MTKKILLTLTVLFLTGCLGDDGQKPVIDLNPLEERISVLEDAGTAPHRHDVSEIDGLSLDFNLNWSLIEDKPSVFTPAPHSHNVSDIVGLELNWDSVTDKPSTFDPSAHTHEISEVNGLQSALNSKAEGSELATLLSSLKAVATSGDYNALDNKPSKLSQFTNDSGFLTDTSSLYGENIIRSIATSVSSTNSVDFLGGNTATITTASDPVININGIRPGGSYSIIIEDPTPKLYSISGCSDVKYVNAIEQSVGISIFSILVSSTSKCYVSFVTNL